MSDAPRDSVLIGYDGYDEAATAIRGAVRLPPPASEFPQRTAEEGAALATAAGMRAGAHALVEHGRIHQTLLDDARDRDAAAIVVGSRGRSGLTAALIGSVTVGLLHHAHVPLHVVPPPD